MPVIVLSPNDDMNVAPQNAPTTAYAASGVIKAGPGVLFGMSGYNSLASAQFIMLFDSPTVPADGALAVEVIAVPASGNFNIDFGVHGKRFITGMSWSNSTTAPTKTIGAANCFAAPRFK